MQQHESKYFAPRHTLDSVVGSKCQTIFFLKVVMLHNKLTGMSKEDHASTYILSLHKP